MYGCESWTVRKAEHRKSDAFELWCWRKLLRVSWPARRSNQSVLKEISPGCSLEGLMLSWNSSTLATSCEELIHWKRPWCWEGLGAGGEGDDRGWDGWMASLTQWTWVWVNSRSWWWTGRPGVLWFMGLQSVRHDWATELNWCVRHLCKYTIINTGYVLPNSTYECLCVKKFSMKVNKVKFWRNYGNKWKTTTKILLSVSVFCRPSWQM